MRFHKPDYLCGVFKLRVADCYRVLLTAAYFLLLSVLTALTVLKLKYLDWRVFPQRRFYVLVRHFLPVWT